MSEKQEWKIKGKCYRPQVKQHEYMSVMNGAPVKCHYETNDGVLREFTLEGHDKDGHKIYKRVTINLMHGTFVEEAI